MPFARIGFLVVRRTLLNLPEHQVENQGLSAKKRFRAMFTRDVMIRTDVDVLLCTSLDARSADGLCKFLGLFLRHLSIDGAPEVRHGINGKERRGKRRWRWCVGSKDRPLFQVRFRAHDDARNRLVPGEIHYFLVNYLNHVKRVARDDRVDEHKAMDSDSVLRIQDRVFILRNR